MLVVSLIMIITNMASICIICIKGLDILYTRLGTDDQETARLISRMGPITSIITLTAAISYFVRYSQLYWSILRHDQQLIACLSNNIFQKAHSSKRAAQFGLVVMVSVQLIYFFNVYEIGKSNSIWINFTFISMAHYLFYYYITTYFFITNIRRLQKLGACPVETVPQLLLTTDLMIRNFEHFLGIASSHWIVLFLDQIIQSSFNIFFVYFQNNKQALFLKNPVIIMGMNSLFLLATCCLSQRLVHSFSCVHRRVTKAAVGNIQSARHHHDHWRVHAFLLGTEQGRLQPRVFHIFNVNLGSFLNVIVFSFDFSIILYQTSSQL